MKTRELVRQQCRIQDLFDKTGKATGGDLEMQAHWAKYLCVLAAGFVENALREVYSSYSISCSNEKVSRFTTSTLEGVRNPKAKKFLEITGAFSKQWEMDLELFIEDNGRKEAINSIMSNRHLIAHGKDSTISLVRVRDYLEKSVEVIDFLENQCGIS